MNADYRPIREGGETGGVIGKLWNNSENTGKKPKRDHLKGTGRKRRRVAGVDRANHGGGERGRRHRAQICEALNKQQKDVCNRREPSRRTLSERRAKAGGRTGSSLAQEERDPEEGRALAFRKEKPSFREAVGDKNRERGERRNKRSKR